MEDRSRRGDWAGALATVDFNAGGRLIDKPTATRWRAVIKTAMAGEMVERDAKQALALAQEALKLAPGFVPAAVIAGRLLSASGDYRRASKLLEQAYAQTPHPDLALNLCARPPRGLRPEIAWPGPAILRDPRRAIRRRC